MYATDPPIHTRNLSATAVRAGERTGQPIRQLSHPSNPCISLPGGQTRLIHAQGGLTLRVLAGRLWLTRPGDACDHFLKAGDCMELSGHGVLVQADLAPGTPGSDAARFELVGSQPAATVTANQRRFWPPGSVWMLVASAVRARWQPA